MGLFSAAGYLAVVPDLLNNDPFSKSGVCCSQCLPLCPPQGEVPLLCCMPLCHRLLPSLQRGTWVLSALTGSLSGLCSAAPTPPDARAAGMTAFVACMASFLDVSQHSLVSAVPAALCPGDAGVDVVTCILCRVRTGQGETGQAVCLAEEAPCER